ncbi:MAG TPA: hypothetical protein VEQ38_11940 [Verrucomicrobiae bacterium]|nr:hypothetical protein [Verrucomicrobiae bacterium]
MLRFENGNLGDHKTVGGGVWEARLDFGPGYRLYFGKDGAALILLLAGGEGVAVQGYRCGETLLGRL